MLNCFTAHTLLLLICYCFITQLVGSSGKNAISFLPSKADYLYSSPIGSQLIVTCLINSELSNTTEWITASGDILNTSSYLDLSQLPLKLHTITCRDTTHNASATILVLIYEPATINIYPEYMTYTLSTALYPAPPHYIYCVASGSPEPGLEWRVNGSFTPVIPITDTDNTPNIAETSNYYILDLAELITAPGTHMLECRAHNYYSTDIVTLTATTYDAVALVPPPNTSNQYIYNNNHTFNAIACSLPDNLLSPDIKLNFSSTYWIQPDIDCVLLKSNRNSGLINTTDITGEIVSNDNKLVTSYNNIPIVYGCIILSNDSSVALYQLIEVEYQIFNSNLTLNNSSSSSVSSNYQSLNTTTLSSHTTQQSTDTPSLTTTIIISTTSSSSTTHPVNSTINTSTAHSFNSTINTTHSFNSTTLTSTMRESSIPFNTTNLLNMTLYGNNSTPDSLYHTDYTNTSTDGTLQRTRPIESILTKATPTAGSLHTTRIEDNTTSASISKHSSTVEIKPIATTNTTSIFTDSSTINTNTITTTKTTNTDTITTTSNTNSTTINGNSINSISNLPKLLIFIIVFILVTAILFCVVVICICCGFTIHRIMAINKTTHAGSWAKYKSSFWRKGKSYYIDVTTSDPNSIPSSLPLNNSKNVITIQGHLHINEVIGRNNQPAEPLDNVIYPYPRTADDDNIYEKISLSQLSRINSSQANRVISPLAVPPLPPPRNGADYSSQLVNTNLPEN